jgi:hypothetical protein
MRYLDKGNENNILCCITGEQVGTRHEEVATDAVELTLFLQYWQKC